jgi:hypothetical protein
MRKNHRRRNFIKKIYKMWPVNYFKQIKLMKFKKNKFIKKTTVGIIKSFKNLFFNNKFAYYNITEQIIFNKLFLINYFFIEKFFSKPTLHFCKHRLVNFLFYHTTFTQSSNYFFIIFKKLNFFNPFSSSR